jgi:hypothetical protein
MDAAARGKALSAQISRLDQSTPKAGAYKVSTMLWVRNGWKAELTKQGNSSLRRQCEPVKLSA